MNTEPKPKSINPVNWIKENFKLAFFISLCGVAFFIVFFVAMSSINQMLASITKHDPLAGMVNSLIFSAICGFALASFIFPLKSFADALIRPFSVNLLFFSLAAIMSILTCAGGIPATASPGFHVPYQEYVFPSVIGVGVLAGSILRSFLSAAGLFKEKKSDGAKPSDPLDSKV